MANYYFDFPGVTGRFTRTVNVPHVTRHSCVVASVVEIKQPQGEPLDFPIIGAAVNMTVKNVCPQDNSTVMFVVDTDWTNGPINVRVTLIVDPA